MKLIRPSVEIIPQAPGLDGIYKQIEKAARTCYKSESQITEDSAKEFADRMIKSGHGAMLEHGTVYLKINVLSSTFKGCLRDTFFKDKYSKHNYDIGNGVAYITTNLRVLVENEWLDDLKYLCEPTEYHEKRVTVRFICDKATSVSFLRHRVFSFAQESTRYCNYSKDKFNNELTFIIPTLTSLEEGSYSLREVEENTDNVLILDKFNTIQEAEFVRALGYAEKSYFNLLKEGWKAQQARAVLPNALKTELVMTGFISDWEHFFKLRCAKSAHPDAQVLANQLKEQFIEKEWIKNQN